MGRAHPARSSNQAPTARLSGSSAPAPPTCRSTPYGANVAAGRLVLIAVGSPGSDDDDAVRVAGEHRGDCSVASRTQRCHVIGRASSDFWG